MASLVDIYREEALNFHRYEQIRKNREGMMLLDVLTGGSQFVVCASGSGESVSVAAASAPAPSGVSAAIAETKKKLKNKKKKNKRDSESSVASSGVAASGTGSAEVDQLKKENKEIRAELAELRGLVRQIQSQLSLSTVKEESVAEKTGAPAPAADDEDDEEIDWSASEDDEEKERLHAERVKAYEEKKSKKPQVIAKSSILFDVKPWDDEADLKEIEKCVRSIETEGLLWSVGAKILPVAYGINKLQIGAVVEDDKVSTDWLEEKITEFEDLVQSVDIVSFQKI